MKPITRTLSYNDRCSEDRTNGTQASPEGLTRRTFLRQSAQLGAATTIALLIGLSLPSAYAATSGTASNKESSFEAIKQQARELMAQYHVPGLAIGVISGKDTFSAGLGVARADKASPFTPATVTYLCSLTKTFTATAAVMLSETGRLDLNARIIDLIPYFHVADHTATQEAKVIDLFHHHTGWYSEHGFDPVGDTGEPLDRALLQAHYLPQLIPFNQAWLYNNTNLVFASRVIEVAAGKPYEEVISELLLQPLGMTSSRFFYGSSAPDGDFAWGHPAIYGGDTSKLKPQFTQIPRAASGAGAMISNVADMLKYARFQIDGLDKNGKVLMSRQALDYAHAPAVDAPTGGKTGVTWFVDDISGVRNVHHMGSFTGYRTWLELIPEREFAVVVLTNSDRGIEVYEPLAEAAIKLFTGLEKRRIAPIDSDPKVLDPYLGRFVGVYQDYLIKRDAGTYRVETKSKPIYPGAPAWADPAPATIANAGNGWFIITDGPKKGLVGELLNDPNGKPNYLRIDHRIFIRETD